MAYRKFTSIVILMQSNIRYWGTNVNRFWSGQRKRLFLRLLYIFVNGRWSQSFSFLQDTIKSYSVAVSSGTLYSHIYVPSRAFSPGTSKHGVHYWFIQHVRQLRTSSTFVTTDLVVALSIQLCVDSFVKLESRHWLPPRIMAYTKYSNR